MKSSQLIFGTFNSEKYWCDNQLATITGDIPNDALKIVSVLDELLFPFLQDQNDILLTRFEIDEAQKQYLRALGVKGNFISLNGKAGDNSVDHSLSIEEITLKRPDVIDGLQKEIIHKVLPYSILPDTSVLLDELNIKHTIPSLDKVKRVNSKFFSSDLNREFNLGLNSECITNSIDLEIKGNGLLKEGPLLIKEIFGVSGTGNVLVQSDKKFSKLLQHFRIQEEKGKKVELLLEPYIENKSIDFSAHLMITPKGEMEILSVQQMENKRFSFNTVTSADNELLKKLHDSDYWNKIEEIGKSILTTGYFGPVCIDSMLLNNGDILPLIEINARMSMGLIHYQLNKFIGRDGIKSKLMSLTFLSKIDINSDVLIDILQKRGLLYSKDKGYGIIPLSSSTLNVNFLASKAIGKDYRGRIYIDIIATENRIDYWLNQFKNILMANGVKIL